MLTSCKLTGSAASISAYHTKEENYYFAQASGLDALGERDAARSHVRIHGKLAGRLGLKPDREISQEAFTNILSGKDAAGNRVSREHKVMGIDLVFSAPKSVSIAALLTEKDPRIVEAHDQAVLEAMREIEASCSGTRVWDGKDILAVQTGNLAYVTARDGFNRDHDPHLHTHVVVMNLTEHGGKVLALDGRQIMAQDFNKMWGALYRSKLAARLKELGYSVSYTKKGELRLDAVSLEMEREFSGRRAQIEKAKASGCRDMDAWRKTRKQKNPEIEKSEVRTDWQSRAARHQEKTAEQIRQETLLAREAWFKAAKWSVEARQELSGERVQSEAGRWQAAARRATERTACPSAEALITEYLTELARGEAWNPITYAEAQHRLQDQVRAGNLLATDDGRYTTWEMTRKDRECLMAHKAAPGLAMEPGAASARLAELAGSLGRRPSEAQTKAAAAILTAGQGIVAVQGDAGSGKTTMLKAVNHAARAAGWEVVGLAVQGVAARKLEDESGISSKTLASYLAGEERAAQAPRQPEPRGPRFVVLDEASMLDSRGLSELLRHGAEHQDKIVLVGDRNQILSVGAGKPFERLVEAAEKAGKLVSLGENYRQRDRALRKAVDLARAGRMRESLDALVSQGKVLEIENQGLRRAAVAAQYGKNTLIVTGSRKNRDELNAIIRQELVHQGDLGKGRDYVLSWKDEDGVRHSLRRELAVGERVVFLENEYQTYDVRNGEVGHIEKAGKDAISIRMEDGRLLSINPAWYGALDYGYALTTYKSQGQTYDKVVVEADTSVPQLQDQRNTYVQITRARDDVRIYTDDKAELRELAGVLNRKTDTHELKVSLEEAQRMELRVRQAALGLQARQEAAAKIVQVPDYAAAMMAEGQAFEAAERAQTRAQATGGEKDWQAWEKAAELAGLAREAAQEAALAETADAPVLGQDAVRAEKAKVRQLDAMCQEAAKAAQEAEEAARIAEARRNEAAGKSNVAQARAAKAHRWGKKAALAAEKEAQRELDAAYAMSKEAWAASSDALERLEVVKERLREAKSRVAEISRFENFRGTPEAVAEAARAIRESREAALKCKVAQAAEAEVRLARDDARHKYNQERMLWEEARSRVMAAGNRVRNARPWAKKAAREAEREARLAFEAAEKRLQESKEKHHEALKRIDEAQERAREAEAAQTAAQRRAAETVRINDLEATREALRARLDLTPAEQHRVAEYLGRSASASILRDSDNPQQAIAAGLIASGTRSAKEATKGMEESVAAKAVDAARRSQESGRRRERGRTREYGFGPDLGLSL